MGQKHTTAQRHSRKSVVLVPGETLGNNVPEWQGHTASNPLASHAIHLSFPVTCLQASCALRIWGCPSAAGSPWRGKHMARPAHTHTHLHLSQPALQSLGHPLPRGEQDWERGLRVTWYNPVGKDFSNSACDPCLGFMSLKTINPKAG